MTFKLDDKKELYGDPEYWVEKINLDLYELIELYKKEHSCRGKDVAQLLKISPGRLSQLKNNGSTNFSLKKIFDFLLKLGKIPLLEFVELDEYLKKEESAFNRKYEVNQPFSELVTMNIEPIPAVIHEEGPNFWFPTQEELVIGMN